MSLNWFYVSPLYWLHWSGISGCPFFGGKDIEVSGEKPSEQGENQ